MPGLFSSYLKSSTVITSIFVFILSVTHAQVVNFLRCQEPHLVETRGRDSCRSLPLRWRPCSQGPQGFGTNGRDTDDTGERWRRLKVIAAFLWRHVRCRVGWSYGGCETCWLLHERFSPSSVSVRFLASFSPIQNASLTPRDAPEALSPNLFSAIHQLVIILPFCCSNPFNQSKYEMCVTPPLEWVDYP